MDQLEAGEPLCSVVVATYQRPNELVGCLEALSQLEMPGGRLEVIVVDDGGGMPLESCLASFNDRLELTLLVQPHGGAASARNLGAAHARGRLLVFTDDDCRPDPEWLRSLADEHRKDPGRALGGRTVNALLENPYAKISDLVVAVGYAQNNPEADAARFLASNNFAVPKDRFRTVGGFSPRFMTSEDRDLCDRWLARGWAMTYVPEAVIRHVHRLTFWGFCRQHFRNGRGLFLFHRVYADRTGRRVRLEPGYYVRLLRAARGAGSGLGKLGLPVLVVVCEVANTAGFLWQWVRQPTRFRTAAAPVNG